MGHQRYFFSSLPLLYFFSPDDEVDQTYIQYICQYIQNKKVVLKMELSYRR